MNNNDTIRWEKAVPEAPESFRRRMRDTYPELEERPAFRPRLAARLAACACALILLLAGGLWLRQAVSPRDALAPGGGSEGRPLWVRRAGGFTDRVYFAPDAEPFYHGSDLCLDLGGARTRPVSVAEALEKGLEPCPRCVTVGGGFGLVYGETTPEEEAELDGERYLVPGGLTYHRFTTCERLPAHTLRDGGLTVVTLREALAGGVGPCPSCCKDRRLSLDVLCAHADEILVYTAVNDNWFHPDIGMVRDAWWGVLRLTAREALEMGKLPCPCSYAYPPDEVSAQNPDMLDEVWSRADAPYYHQMKMCQGELYGEGDSVSKWKLAGKAACPVCMRERPVRDASGLAESVAESIVFCGRGDAFYHRDFHCEHADGSGATHTLRAAWEAGKQPCPYCAG